jgi:hypothetical protein
MNEPAHSPAPKKSTRAQIAWGFATSGSLFGLAFAAPPGEFGRVLPYILAITILPLAAIILSIILPTRKFGLGMLLGCGAIWLVMLAICGGAFR